MSKDQLDPSNAYTTPLISQMESRVGSTVKARYIYEYDVCGNITSILDNGTLLSSYEYDGLNRLIRENNVNDNTITVYYYNNGGNLTEKRIYSYSTYSNTATDAFLNITPKKTITYGYSESGQKDRLLSYNGTEDLTYDGHGNPRQWFKHVRDNSYLRYGLSWSKVNRLTEITDTETNSKYEYTYDYNGIRTSKKVGNTLHKYYLDGSNIIAETRTTDGVTSKLKYYYGTMGIVGFNYNGTDYYYPKNIQGDIVRIYNNSGTLYGEYRYDAWGKCTIVTDINGIATINPFRYRGYYLDNETGLCYLNSRYYDPTVGRFLSPDSLEYLEPEDLGGLNLYSYCNNNPVMYFDPSGHFIISLLIASIVGFAILGGVAAGLTAYENGASGWGIFGSAVLGTLFGGAIGALAGLAMGFIGPAIGGLGAMLFGDVMAMSGAMALVGVLAQVGVAAGAIYVTAAGATAIGNVNFAQTSKSGGYYGERWPGDHSPAHVHLKGNGVNIRIGVDGKPLPKEPKLNPQAKRALKKLWKEFVKLFNRW